MTRVSGPRHTAAAARSQLHRGASAAAAGLFTRLAGRLQWRVLWLTNDAFVIGVTGVVLDDTGRVLLLEHRYWKDNPWGLPSGWVERGETFEQAFAREVREETGLRLHDVQVVSVHSGFRLRVEVRCSARVAGTPATTPDGSEVLSARFLTVAQTREQRLRPAHRELIDVVSSTNQP